MDNREDLYLREMAEQGYAMGTIDDFHRAMIPYLLRSHGVLPSETVLEIGPAQGHCIISAFQAGYRKLVAIDYIDTNFSVFKDSYGIDCRKVDITKDPFPLTDGSVGAILFFHTIEHIADAHLCLSEMLRVLRPGGVAFVVTPDWRKQYKGFFSDPTHVKPYDKVGLSRLMRIVGWKELHVQSWGPRFGLGRLHAFRLLPRLGMIGMDILVVARKSAENISIPAIAVVA
jgi:SAM-dependent methyltransferase